MDKSTKDILAPFISLYQTNKRTYKSRVKSIHNGIATLENGVQIAAKGLEVNHDVIILHVGLNPRGIDIA